MKKNLYLGLSKDCKRCIILTTVACRDDIEKAAERNELIPSDFNQFYATNWNGSDDITRTIELEELRLLDKKYAIDLEKPLEFVGSDRDGGLARYWKFEVSSLVAVERI